jgi:hypothetical protein
VKLIKILTSLAVLVLTIGCKEDFGVSALLERVIANNSSYDVEYTVWYDGVIQTSQSMSSGEEVSYVGREFEGTFDSYLEGLGWLNADSMIVVIQDSLKTVFFQPDSCQRRTPVQFSYGPNACFGYESQLLDGVEISTFTFTDADFEDAEVIGD